MDKIQCSATVCESGTWGAFHPSHCQKTAKVERDGKWYCKIHDPEYIKQKSDASMKRYHEKLNADRPKYYGPALLAMLEKILPIFEEGIQYNYSESEPHQQLLREAKELIAKAKGEK